MCSVSLPNGAMGGTTVYYFGIQCAYSFAFALRTYIRFIDTILTAESILLFETNTYISHIELTSTIYLILFQVE